MMNVNMKRNPLYSFKDMNPLAQPERLGDSNMMSDIAFNPTVREVNQQKTAAQVNNYASSKMMAQQGRTDMRGNVAGYTDTLG